MRRFAAGLLLGASLCCPGQASASEPSELKAAFVVNFAKFTRWPENHAGGHMRLCFPTVAEAVGAAMARMTDIQINGRPARVYRGVDPRGLHHCHVVYLGADDDHRRAELLAELNDSQALTVSDLPGFIASGGMIELFRQGRKYRFSVNRGSLAAAGLEINARLLGLARKVGERHDQ